MTTDTIGKGGTEGRRRVSTMVVGRIIGWLFLAAALAAFGWDISAAFGDGWTSAELGLNPWNWIKHVVFGDGWEVSAFGLRWFQLHSPSLGFGQVIFQRFIPVVGPWLWDPAIQTVLLWPAWAVLGVPGIVFSFLFRRRRRGRRWFT